MKILFTAPRFHTNQYSISKSLIENGNDVNYFVQYIGKSELHDYVKPILLKQSIISVIIIKIITRFLNTNEQIKKAEMKWFIPSWCFLYKKLKEYKPNVIVCRERSLFTLSVYILSSILKFNNIILYNQSPAYRSEMNKPVLKKILFKMTKGLFPKVRMTTVEGDKSKVALMEKDTYFIPFIVETTDNINDRKYFKDNKINILSVGKYQKAKNFPLLVEAINILKQKNYDIKCTIIGEVSNKYHEGYYDKLCEKIKGMNLDDVITLKINIPYEYMKNYYLDNDIFILSSQKELASVSILEAMASGLATISSNANGTCTYIKKGVAGYVFNSNDLDDLVRKIEQIISERNEVVRLGRGAIELIKTEYSPENYCRLFFEMVENEFELT